MDGQALALTPKEFDLLGLCREPGTVFARILEEVWDAHGTGQDARRPRRRAA